MKHAYRAFVGITVLVMAGLACSLVSGSSATPPAAATLNQLYTAAAQTVQAAGTPGSAATSTASPTNPFPTFALTAPTRTSAPVVQACNAATFVRDVTIADGERLGASEDFTKTWRLMNVGTCSWTSDYSLVFVSGDHMQGPASEALPGTVNPGHSVDLSVDLTAPNRTGSYQGYWKLRSSSGVLFGIGSQAQDAFWVKINVAGPTYTAYDFVANFCAASWQNNKNDLPCPGQEGDGQGYVVELDHPILENGGRSDDPGLLTVPKNSSNGYITGTYPAIRIKDGDRFQSLINCQYKAYGCNVFFRLDYQIGNGSFKTLGTWNEAYEGKYFTVDLDLSTLSGQNVKFFLTVSTNGSFDQDQALWIAPRITRRGSPPPTDTPTPTSSLTPTPSLTPSATATASPTNTPEPTATP